MNSVTPDTRNNSGRKPRYIRQNGSAASGSSARITDRKHLTDLWKWVTALHDQRGWSFRKIAEHTTRGKGSHGYWQAVYSRAHMEKRPRIRPCEYDWHDIKLLYKVVGDYAANDGRLFDLLLEFESRYTEMHATMIKLVELVKSK